MLAHFPAEHRREMEAYAETAFSSARHTPFVSRTARRDRDKLLAMNTMLDVYGAFACSSLVVEAARSAAGSPIFGRNLDIISLGVLERYGLVAVYRAAGKLAFVSVCFPGVFGVFSGMNERGLALALHGVFRSDDGSPVFDHDGTPCTMFLRRILEECSTVREAEQRLRAGRHTTALCVVLCDRIHGAVAEVWPGGVAVRKAENGICACTNHFRAGRNVPVAACRRYAGLLRNTETGKLAVEAVARKLHEVHQGSQTVQTMVFEPGPLHLHLAMGSCPSSALPLRRLAVGPLLQGENVS
jgi:predicted choloylglycine hydrolase